MNDMKLRQDRLKRCNGLIQTIASVGRKFFGGADYSRPVLPVAFLELDRRGRVYFHDEYTGRRIYTHWKHKPWNGWNHGGGMQNLIAKLRDYILHGRQLAVVNPTYPKWFNPDGGDMWGYGPEATAIVNEKARELGIMKAQIRARVGQVEAVEVIG